MMSAASAGLLRPTGRLAMPWSTPLMIWWVALLFGLVLLVTGV